MALTDTELTHHTVAQALQVFGRPAWSVAMRLAFNADVLQCDSGSGRSPVAVIDEPPVLNRILAHLGLHTESLIMPDDPVWRFGELKRWSCC